MITKTGTWLMAIGAFVAFAGLCFLPAAFGPDSDRTMLGAGAVVVKDLPPDVLAVGVPAIVKKKGYER